MAKSDKRGKYRQLPPPTQTSDTTASVGDEPESVEADNWDPNEGAAPYLRTTWGPWVR
jgi:hypothetical protein